MNRSGTEYACAQGWGFFDGPSDSASIAAIASWKANAVRVPLNETCWLAINGVKPAYAGANYARAIGDFVDRLNRAGLVVILELHWSAADTAIALGQAPMPNRDHTLEFWRQVAAAYGSNNRVIFDLYNEPFPDSNRDTPEAWRCWRDGGTCGGMSFQAAGMQELVDTIRSTGATNVLMVGGVQYAATLSHWVANKPTDPRNSCHIGLRTSRPTRATTSRRRGTSTTSAGAIHRGVGTAPRRRWRCKFPWCSASWGRTIGAARS